jgi:hypothetical protein
MTASQHSKEPWVSVCHLHIGDRVCLHCEPEFIARITRINRCSVRVLLEHVPKGISPYSYKVPVSLAGQSIYEEWGCSTRVVLLPAAAPPIPKEKKKAVKKEKEHVCIRVAGQSRARALEVVSA